MYLDEGDRIEQLELTYDEDAEVPQIMRFFARSEFGEFGIWGSARSTSFR